MCHHLQANKEAGVFFLFLLFFFVLPGLFASNAELKNPVPAIYTDNPKPIVILKCDDFELNPQWERFITYCETMNLNASIGVVGKQLDNEGLREWINRLKHNPAFEFWSHGLTHDCGSYPEFNGTPYEDQFSHIMESQRVFNERVGITFNTFGAPCNKIDNNTSRALTDSEDVHVWLFGKGEWSGLSLERRGEIEFPYGYPNYSEFVDGYNTDQLERYDYLVFQLHPGFWDESLFGEFEKVMDFLYDKGVIIMTSREYYQAITTIITVSNSADSGPGSLRAAISRVNQDNPQNAVIILPAGTYYLTGLNGEDMNTGGDLDIAANLTIQGDGPASTIIDGGQNDRVLDIQSGRVNIFGVSICHGKADNGGGIRVKGGIVTIRNCTISDNTINPGGNSEEISGGGIYAENARITLSGCEIFNNKGNSSTGARGGGICINQNNTRYLADVRNCLIAENTANTNAAGPGRGGGLYVISRNPGYEVTVFNNTFRKNKAGSGGQGEGGGIYLRETGLAFLTRNRFIENTASVKGSGYGGAIFADGGANVTMTNNLLTENNANSAGGGIYIKGFPGGGPKNTSTAALLHNTIARKTPAAGEIGNEGLYAGDHVALSLTNNVICGHNTGINLDSASGSSSITADTNLFYNTNDPVAGNHALLQDPLLTSDWKPGETSPVVDAGKIINEVTRDLEGNIRPQGEGYDIGCYEYLPVPTPVILTDKALLNFASSGSSQTGSQSFHVSNSGSGVLNWNAVPAESWIEVKPATGTNGGNVTVTVAPGTLSPGTYNGSISITAADAVNSPQTVKVNLTVYNHKSTDSPFGIFAAPENASTDVSGAIPLTGWALDDIQVEKVEIYLEQGKSLVYIDEAIFIEGARPDVEQAYLHFPFNYRAGWGYMLLTNFLPNQGNGTFTFHALAKDTEGNQTTVGTRTITCDNAHAVKPFGTIDIPGQGGTISGKSYANWGWVLTPQPNHIPTDGSTINVWIDGVNQGHPKYNIYREDIASLFPGYLNSSGATGYAYLNTTAFANGLHTLQWTAEDSAGNKDGIGSRYIYILNDGNSSRSYGMAGITQHRNKQPIVTTDNLVEIPIDPNTSLGIKKGFRDNENPQPLYPNEKGIFYIASEELERLEIRFPGDSREINGFQLVGDRLRPLPVGSILNSTARTFHWLPGPGFVGLYRLSFTYTNNQGKLRRMDVTIEINRKRFH